MDYKYCSICLVTDTRFFPFTNNKQKIFITNIFQKSGYSQAQKPNLTEYICYQCRALLEKTYKFIQQGLTSQHILKEINELGNLSPADYVKEIKQYEYKLRNILELSVEPQCINFIFTENEQDLSNSSTKVKSKQCTIDRVNKKRKYQFSTLKSKKNEIEDVFVIESEDEIKGEGDDDEIDYRVKDEMECEFICQNGDAVGTSNSLEDDPLIIKRGRKYYQQSNFMLTLSSIPEKRQRKQVNYKIKTKQNDDSDNLEKNRRNSDQSSDFEPKSDDSDSSSNDSLHLYNDQGKRLKKDPRIYPMECDDCDAIINVRKEHYHHYLEMHPHLEYPYRIKDGTYLCDICGFVTYRKILYETHLQRHSTNKKLRCPKCPKIFNSKLHLATHVTSWHKDYRVECDYCGKKFIKKTDLRLHIRIHTGEKPYKCHICGAGFAHNGNVGIHIRTNHQKAPRGPHNQKSATKKSTQIKKTSKHHRSSEDCESPSIPLKKTRGRKSKKFNTKKKDVTDSDT